MEPDIPESTIQQAGTAFLQLVSGLWHNYSLICTIDGKHSRSVDDMGKLAFLDAAFDELIAGVEGAARRWMETLEVPDVARDVLSLSGNADDDRQAIAYFSNIVLQMLRPFKDENIQAIREAGTATAIFDALVRQGELAETEDLDVENAKASAAEGVLVGGLEVLRQVI